MIRDQELLHGAAIMRLLDHGLPVTIQHAPDVHSSIYLVRGRGFRAALLLKLSTRRKSPWQFTFTRTESDALASLVERHPDHSRLLALVCHVDGVCCLNHDRLAEVLDDPLDLGGRSLSVSRPTGGSYRVSGPDRRPLGRTIPMSDWPGIIFTQETL